MKVTHGSLFSGVGGFDLAAEWMGWENVFHCEIEPFCQKILNYYWPKSISYDDIKTTDFTIHRGRIDVLTGGFPCQPFSQAGKRKGTDDNRYLWPEMLRAIREIQPGYIVGENVRGLTNWNGGLVFDQVQADLENEGYEVLPFLLPACAVNAPHRRDRIWLVAHCQNMELQGGPSINQRGESKPHNGNEVRNTIGANGEIPNVTHPKEQRLEKWNGKQSRNGTHPTTERHNSRSSWQDFPTQSPICNGNDGLPLQLDGITFPKWRNESIKGAGNAIVPQVVFEIFKAIQTTLF